MMQTNVSNAEIDVIEHDHEYEWVMSILFYMEFFR